MGQFELTHYLGMQSLDLRSGFAHTPPRINSLPDERDPTKSRRPLGGTPSMLNMGGPFTLQIKNSFEAVRSAGTAMSQWLADQGAPAEIQNFANLALEEFGTNSIKYGYDDANEHWIEVALSISGSELIVNIIDDGRAFNPLKAPEPPFDIPIEERPVGGLGIYLVRKMSDHMEYLREGGKNRLTLHKKWPPPIHSVAPPRS